MKFPTNIIQHTCSINPRTNVCLACNNRVQSENVKYVVNFLKSLRFPKLKWAVWILKKQDENARSSFLADKVDSKSEIWRRSKSRNWLAIKLWEHLGPYTLWSYCSQERWSCWHVHWFSRALAASRIKAVSCSISNVPSTDRVNPAVGILKGGEHMCQSPFSSLYPLTSISSAALEGSWREWERSQVLPFCMHGLQITWHWSQSEQSARRGPSETSQDSLSFRKKHTSYKMYLPACQQEVRVYIPGTPL